MKEIYGLPDSISVKGMFASAKMNGCWVLQEKETPEDKDIYIATVGSFQPKYPIFVYKHHYILKADWAYMWEQLMSIEMGFAVYIVESKNAVRIMGIVDDLARVDRDGKS